MRAAYSLHGPAKSPPPGGQSPPSHGRGAHGCPDTGAQMTSTLPSNLGRSKMARIVRCAIGLVMSTGLCVVAAKAHGRQLRLERELEGHHSVVFGGVNHPWVEQTWRRDRHRFWILTPLLAVTLAAVL